MKWDRDAGLFHSLFSCEVQFFFYFGLKMILGQFYTKMDHLCDAERSWMFLESAKICEKLFFDMVDLKIEGDLFSHNLPPEKEYELIFANNYMYT